MSLCQHCSQKTTDVYQMPISYNIELQEFLVQGNFCSLECMKSYNAHLNDSFRSNRFSLITQMYDLYDKDIKMAPPKESLQCFGGTMSIEDFRKNNSTYSYKNLPPLKILEFKNESSNQLNNFTWLNNIELSTNQVALERKKPDKNQFTLDKIMNLQTID